MTTELRGNRTTLTLPKIDACADQADTPSPTAASPAPPRHGSKGAAMLELLSRRHGASIEDMAERTGWQNHTVRAAMTGLRKRGYVVVRQIRGTMPMWSIAAEPSAGEAAMDTRPDAEA